MLHSKCCTDRDPFTERSVFPQLSFTSFPNPSKCVNAAWLTGSGWALWYIALPQKGENLEIAYPACMNASNSLFTQKELWSPPGASSIEYHWIPVCYRAIKVESHHLYVLLVTSWKHLVACCMNMDAGLDETIGFFLCSSSSPSLDSSHNQHSSLKVKHRKQWANHHKKAGNHILYLHGFGLFFLTRILFKFLMVEHLIVSWPWILIWNKNKS